MIFNPSDPPFWGNDPLRASWQQARNEAAREAAVQHLRDKLDGIRGQLDAACTGDHRKRVFLLRTQFDQAKAELELALAAWRKQGGRG